MKKIFICALSLLTAAWFFVSCTEDSTLYCGTTKPQFNSLSDPKAVAFFHNATIEAYLETITRSDDISPNDDHCCPEKFYHKVSCLTEPSSGTSMGTSGLL